MNARARAVVHHLVAHPLLVICPPLGRRLHDATAPSVQHPSVVGVRFAAMYVADPAGGWRVRRHAISTGRLTGDSPGERGPARFRRVNTASTTIDGEGSRRPVALWKVGR